MAAIVCLVLGALGWHPWWLFESLGFDFDEVLMVCMGLAAAAYVTLDFKRERETTAYLVQLHEDLGRIKTMVGWDLPHSISERIAKLEAVAPEGIAEKLAAVDARVSEAIQVESRVAVLEDDAEFDRLVDRVSALEKRTRKPKAKAKPEKVTT